MRILLSALRAAFFGLFLVSAACSSSSGAPGGSCSSAGDCNGGLCATSQDFPGGYCTQGCSLKDPASCPSGSVCIDDVSGVQPGAGITAICYQACQTTSDCGRSGYACLEKSSRLVCRNGG